VVVAVAALAVGAVIALCRAEAKEVLVDVVAGGAAGVTEGANAVSSSAIRAMTESRLTSGYSVPRADSLGALALSR
jgi:hypothetical protein